MDHIIKEEHLEEVCPYCKKEVPSKEFKIELIEGVTYKTIKCKCGKKLNIKVNEESKNFKDGEGNQLIERIKFEENKNDKQHT